MLFVEFLLLKYQDVTYHFAETKKVTMQPSPLSW